MAYVVAGPLFVFAVLLQCAVIPGSGLFGARPDLLLVLVCAWAIVRSREEAMLAAPPAALLAGLLRAGPIGLPLLALIGPIGGAMLQRNLRGGGFFFRLMLVVLLSTVWSSGLDLVVSFLSGQHTMYLAGIGSFGMGAIMLNLLLATVLYWPFRLARKRTIARATGLSLS
ncbi:MAG: rod shape-determining protein MreD [Dehalococcoidia bacterium]